MQLNTTTQYTIRTLLFLAARREPASGNSISQSLEIPYPEQMDILSQLEQMGLVSAPPYGEDGYTLEVPPEEITLWDILGLEGDGPKICRIVSDGGSDEFDPDSGARVEKVYIRLESCLEQVLRGVTLQDIWDKMS
jgi:Rrf2 family protein